MPVLLAFSAPDDDLAPLEVDVLDAQAKRLQQAQAGAVEQGTHKRGRPRQARQNSARPPRASGPPARARDAWRGRDRPATRSSRPSTSWYRNSSAARAWFCVEARDLRLGGERRKKGPDLELAHGLGMALAVKDDEPANPADDRPSRCARCSGASAAPRERDRAGERPSGAAFQGHLGPGERGSRGLPTQARIDFIDPDYRGAREGGCAAREPGADRVSASRRPGSRRRACWPRRRRPGGTCRRRTRRPSAGSLRRRGSPLASPGRTT